MARALVEFTEVTEENLDGGANAKAHDDHDLSEELESKAC